MTRTPIAFIMFMKAWIFDRYSTWRSFAEAFPDAKEILRGVVLLYVFP